MKEINFFKLSLNIYLEMLLRFSSVVINTIMISRYNVFLIGAMSSANQIFIIATTIFSFLSIGSSVLISQALGAKNKNLAIKSAHISLSFNVILGIFIFFIIHFFDFKMLKLLNVPDEIFNYSLIYLQTIAYVILLDCVNIALSSVIRTYAKAKELMIVSLVMNAVNIIFNAIFLYKYDLGLFGVGISSIISRIVCLIMLVYIYFKIAKLRIYFKLFFNINKDIFKKILTIGGFSAGENLLWSAQYMVVFAFVGLLGKDAMSIQSIFFQISMFIFTMSSALSVANEIIIGRLVGAKEYEKAYKHSFVILKIAIILSFIFASFVFIFQDYIFKALDLNDDLIKIIKPLFIISFVLETSRAMNIVMVNSLRASSDAAYPFYMGIIFMWGVSVPLAYILGIHFGFAMVGIWSAFVADEFLRGLANTYRWKSKKWQNKSNDFKQ